MEDRSQHVDLSKRNYSRLSDFEKEEKAQILQEQYQFIQLIFLIIFSPDLEILERNYHIITMCEIDIRF